MVLEEVGVTAYLFMFVEWLAVAVLEVYHSGRSVANRRQNTARVVDGLDQMLDGRVFWYAKHGRSTTAVVDRPIVVGSEVLWLFCIFKEVHKGIIVQIVFLQRIGSGDIADGNGAAIWAYKIHDVTTFHEDVVGLYYLGKMVGIIDRRTGVGVLV